MRVTLSIKMILALTALALIASTTRAQTPDIVWERTFGDENRSKGFAIQRVDDGFILVGTIEGGIALRGLIYLIRCNEEGDTLWTKIYGPYRDAHGRDVIPVDDGGFIVLSSANYYGIYGDEGVSIADLYLTKINSAGELLWEKVYGSENSELANRIKRTRDGGYIVLGSTLYQKVISTSIYLVKTDSKGDSLWTKIIGNAHTPFGSDIIQTADGGYLIIGNRRPDPNSAFDAFLLKTDATGSTEWDHTYGGKGKDGFIAGHAISTGGYFLAGGKSSDIWLVWIDDKGKITKEKTIDLSPADLVTSCIKTSDGGYVITGRTGDNYKGYNMLLLKLNSEGEVQWTKSFGGRRWASGVQLTSDGGYLVVGSKAHRDKYNQSHNLLYLVKFK